MPGNYSIFALARNALTGHRNWASAWRSPPPQSHYDVIIVGGGGHGLATAYYLAKEHGIRRIAVLEKGWIGGGNTGRNTTIVRSNYYLAENARFYEHSLKLWENLSQDINYNVMFSQRGFLQLAHSPAELESLTRRGNAMRFNGIDAELLNRKQVEDMVPFLETTSRARYPVAGGLLQPRAGTARHDAVAWGFARAADALGVDIIQNCEVTAIQRENGRIVGVQTTQGRIGASKIGLCVAGHSTQLAGMADVRLPIESHTLQALVSEPVKPMLDTVVFSPKLHFYISQSDKGELVMGGEIDRLNSFSQRGGPQVIEEVTAAAISLFPVLSRLRVLRTWGGVCDMTMDGAPIIAKLPVDGLYLNGGWCYGGFKATPGSGWVFAHTIAQDRPHPLNEAFSLGRFSQGRLIDDNGSGPYPWQH